MSNHVPKCKLCGEHAFVISGVSKGGRNVYLKRHKCSTDIVEEETSIQSKELFKKGPV
jgi:hypothetical protein